MGNSKEYDSELIAHLRIWQYKNMTKEYDSELIAHLWSRMSRIAQQKAVSPASSRVSTLGGYLVSTWPLATVVYRMEEQPHQFQLWQEVVVAKSRQTHIIRLLSWIKCLRESKYIKLGRVKAF